MPYISPSSCTKFICKAPKNLRLRPSVDGPRCCLVSPLLFLAVFPTTTIHLATKMHLQMTINEAAALCISITYLTSTQQFVITLTIVWVAWAMTSLVGDVLCQTPAYHPTGFRSEPKFSFRFLITYHDPWHVEAAQTIILLLYKSVPMDFTLVQFSVQRLPVIGLSRFLMLHTYCMPLIN